MPSGRASPSHRGSGKILTREARLGGSLALPLSSIVCDTDHAFHLPENSFSFSELGVKLSTHPRLVIPRAIFDAMLVHARETLPQECCGFLAGEIVDGVARVSLHLPLTNELASPTEYAVPVRELVETAKRLRAANLRELAVYHSHPTSEPIPSRRDIDRNGYGDSVIHVIVGLAVEPPEVRAWWLTEAGAIPARWEVAD